MTLSVKDRAAILSELIALPDLHAALIVQGPDGRVLLVDVPPQALLRIRDIVMDARTSMGGLVPTERETRVPASDTLSSKSEKV